MADFLRILENDAVTSDLLSLGGTWAADAEQEITFDNGTAGADTSLLFTHAIAYMDFVYDSATMVLLDRVVDMYVLYGDGSANYEEYDSTNGLPQASHFVDSFRLTENHTSGTGVLLASVPFELLSDEVKIVLTNVSGETIAAATTFKLRPFTWRQDEQS